MGLEKRIPHPEGVKAQGAAVCRTFAMPQGDVIPVEKSMGEADSTGRVWLTDENRIDRCSETDSISRKVHERKRLVGEKWFKFLRWSIQIWIGRLWPHVMTGHCGSIMVAN
jgi:hypothetical protein